jgi:hypothetical protein
MAPSTGAWEHLLTHAMYPLNDTLPIVAWGAVIWPGRGIDYPATTPESRSAKHILYMAWRGAVESSECLRLRMFSVRVLEARYGSGLYGGMWRAEQRAEN